MASESVFVCPLLNGVHARPASAMEEVARRFGSEILILNERTGHKANAKSVLSLVGADIKHQDACRLLIAGQDEAQAFAAMDSFIRNDFPACDEPLPDPVPGDGQVFLPRSLRRIMVHYYTGTAVVQGIGEGRGVIINQVWSFEQVTAIPALALEAEMARMEQALDQLRGRFQDKLHPGIGDTEKKILEAHLSILRDPELHQWIVQKMRRSRCSVAQAIVLAVRHFGDMLKATGSALLRERIIDIQDVCAQLIREIYGDIFPSAEAHLAGPSVVVAENLTPSQFLALDRTRLKGLILTQGGLTSHTIILARSFDIPTVTNLTAVSLPELADRQIILDADRGIVVMDPSADTERFYQREQQTLQRRRDYLARFARQPAQTRDGQRMEVAANVTTAAEVATVMAHGAEGVGLFRTEMLFLERNQPPTEEEQYHIYLEAVTGAAGRPVIFRTLDVGGDKPLAYLNIPGEANPFLGYRAIRMYPEYEEVFRTQLRAILRASAHGPAKLMIPMVCCLEEIRWTRTVLTAVQQELDRQQVAYDHLMPLGIMVEVPSLAFMIDQLAAEVDFFSIGTNDLAQYFLAADRENRKLSSLYSYWHPSFLRLLQAIVNDAHRMGKWVGMCGEMAGDLMALPLLVGLGLDEISLGASHIPAIKAAITQTDAARCRDMIPLALGCDTILEVRQLLKNFQGTGNHRPLVAEELIHFEDPFSSKEDAIKAAVDYLYVCGRTNDPQAVEEAIWQREEVYSTGLGFGFAIPHCKSDAMRANSVSILRLKHPVVWNSLDGQPVELIILLAIRQSDKNNTHMRIFAQLARKIMHEEFRQQLLAAADPAAILTCLVEALSLEPGG